MALRFRCAFASLRQERQFSDGRLAVSIVCLLAGLLVGASPAQGQIAKRPALGFHIARGDSQHTAAAHAAGASFVVVVFSWRDIEPVPNYFYWEAPDAALRAAEYYGLDVVARLDRPPAWAEENAGPAPWSNEAYASFVGRVAARYGNRLDGVILWNEPNLALEWAGRRPDPAGYLTLLQTAYPAVKEAAPGLPVLLAGLAFTRGDGTVAVEDLAYLRDLYRMGAGAYFDILAAHPYGFGRPPGEAPAADQLNFRRLELHRAIMAEFGDDQKPIWITEMGWRTSAPDPADRWQVVTAHQQRDYTQQALVRGAAYPWLERMALWELNAGEDNYGYGLWRGERAQSTAYEALVAHHKAAVVSGETAYRSAAAMTAPFTILSSDVSIRLGDRGELHPHWVHLHRSGERFSPEWQGEFFLDTAAASQTLDLVLETMQIDQPTNRVAVNGRPIGLLAARTRPDPTSTWKTQRLAIPPGVLQPGLNTVQITSGQRNPARQYSWWRWENFQFRHLRFEVRSGNKETGAQEALAWQPLPSPGGWSETNRLRIGGWSGGVPNLWLTGNRTGELWRFIPQDGAASTAINEAGNLAGAVFLDVAVDGATQVAATDMGLFQRLQGGAWMRSKGAPGAYAHVLLRHADAWYAGFEKLGLWSVENPGDRWRLVGLAGKTVLDLATAGSRLYAATDQGVHVRAPEGVWQALPSLPADGQGAAAAAFIPRLWIGDDGTLVVRSQDRLFRWEAKTAVWEPYGPAALQGRLYHLFNCCRAGTLIGANLHGLWQLDADDAWNRADDGIFDDLEVTGGLAAGNSLYVATTNGLFSAPLPIPPASPLRWQGLRGLPATVTDLLVDPAAAGRWLASTPTGIYRSLDGGASWRAISPPWIVWDMAWSADGRLWVARMDGIAWNADTGAEPVRWTTAGGMEAVTFFTVSPDPVDAVTVWAGSWGNNLGVSRDGGATLAPLHNGLETLSVLAILRHAAAGQFTIGTIEGIYRSDDGGASWFKLPGPLAQQTVYALHQGDDGAIWAGAADGLWVSRDFGAEWSPVDGLPAATVLRIGAIVGDEGNLLWAGTEGEGLWFSTNGGASWQSAGLATRTVYQVVPNPAQRGGWLAATDSGIFASNAPTPSSVPSGRALDFLCASATTNEFAISCAWSVILAMSIVNSSISKWWGTHLWHSASREDLSDELSTPRGNRVPQCSLPGVECARST